MNGLQKKILCTLGPASWSERVISRLEGLGVSMFRINLSHTKIEDLSDLVKSIQKYTSVPICLDTEGAQLRTGKMKNGHIIIRENSVFRIVWSIIEGDEERINLYPSDSIKCLRVGDLISLDFNSALVQVIGIDELGLLVRVITGGQVGSNKAADVDREIPLPSLTQKDKDAIKVGLGLGLTHYALSFANRLDDVELIRSLVGERNFVISKIETLTGVQNLDAISKHSDAILLDRGDLSRQLPIEQIPRAQKEIISRARKNNAKCFVATNLLESMCSQPNPTRAEVNDIFNTLDDGADGLVLAAETAIGKYPIECAMMVHKLIRQFMEYSNRAPFLIDKISTQNPYLLVDPHGGSLVNRMVPDAKPNKWEDLPKIFVTLSSLMDVEQIAIGTYSPLEGFLTKNEVESVLDNYCLKNGTVWTLPITLQVDSEQLKDISSGDCVALCLEGSDEVYASLEISEIYSYDLQDFAQRISSTADSTHPGVQLLYKGGLSFLAGKIRMSRRLPSGHKQYELTPKQARSIFEKKHWVRVLGFHTRNAAHRAHEYIQIDACEKFHCDGIFIHPLVGPKKKGDYASEAIIKSYEMITEKNLSHHEMLIAAFQNYPRYFGPREAVFTAICRKNFGCSHFVVGRDHSGVGNFYENDAAQKLFIDLGDIGIKPIFFNEVNYCKKCSDYTQACDHGAEEIMRITGTGGRDMIKNRQLPPDWYMRTDISNYLINEIKEGRKVFVD